MLFRFLPSTSTHAVLFLFTALLLATPYVFIRCFYERISNVYEYSNLLTCSSGKRWRMLGLFSFVSFVSSILRCVVFFGIFKIELYTSMYYRISKNMDVCKRYRPSHRMLLRLNSIHAYDSFSLHHGDGSSCCFACCCRWCALFRFSPNMTELTKKNSPRIVLNFTNICFYPNSGRRKTWYQHVLEFRVFFCVHRATHMRDRKGMVRFTNIMMFRSFRPYCVHFHLQFFKLCSNQFFLKMSLAKETFSQLLFVICRTCLNRPVISWYFDIMKRLCRVQFNVWFKKEVKHQTHPNDKRIFGNHF